ncbi:hypothetical protein Q3G72_008555 [Acer saccharum]|nr:hypothetical protein Q3G72_008555 [Acer saccharum]
MSGFEGLEGNLTSKVERKEIDSDEEVTLLIKRFRRFMKSQKRGMTSKVKEEKKCQGKVTLALNVVELATLPPSVDNLQLHAKMTYLNDEVRCVKEIEGRLKMELEEAISSLAKITSSSDIDDSLKKIDIVVVSEKEIED